MGWTEERVELLKKLWLEGLSASQIAGVLGEGVTRNAVIGKVHRLKLTGRAKPASSTPRARTAPRAPGIRRVSTSSGAGRPSSGIASMMKSRSMPAAPMHGATALKIDTDLEVEAYVAPQVQELYIPEDQRLSLLQLNEHTCKWPIGDPLSEDFHFCGNESGDSSPYCSYHCRLAYQPTAERRRAR